MFFSILYQGNDTGSVNALLHRLSVSSAVDLCQYSVQYCYRGYSD